MMDINEISVGMRIPELEKTPTRPQLFRYSALTWNTHRIHYDPEYAKVEGHPDVLVQAHLHGAFLQELVMDWVGTHGELIELEWMNVGRATPEDSLTLEGEIAAINREKGTIELDVRTRTSEAICAKGSATVSF